MGIESPKRLYTNNASTKTTAVVHPSTTVIPVADVSVFPSPSTGQYFVATLVSGTLREIIKVTYVSGSSLICTRAQEGTSAGSFAAGSTVEVRVTAESLKRIADDLEVLRTSDKYIVASGGYTASTNMLALNMSDGSVVNLDLTAVIDDTIETLPAASVSTYGKIKLATPTTAIEGTDSYTAVTPEALNAAIYAAKDAFDVGSSADLEKFVKAKRFTQEFNLNATLDQVLPKTDASSLIGQAIIAATPAATETISGLVELASAAETALGVDGTKAVTPSGLKPSLDLKAPLASPALTGTPTAPTASANTATTQVATTGFVIGQASSSTPLALATDASAGSSTKFARADHVHALPTAAQITSVATGDVSATTVQGALAELSLEKAPLASPALTGMPTTPTATAGTNTTQIASTAFVTSAIAAIPAASDTTPGLVPLAVGSNYPSVSNVEATTPVYVTTAINTLVPVSSTTVVGKVRLSTVTEATTGTDATTAVTPAGLHAAIAAIPADKYLQGLSGYNATTNVLTLLMNDGSTVAVDLTSLVNDAVASVPAATTTSSGVTRLATPAEATTGTSTTIAVTPAGVEAAISSGSAAAVPYATTTVAGKIRIATSTEVNTGTDSTTVVTPSTLAAVAALKAPLDSPTLTGTPAAPTATADTSTTQLATTAFVINQVSTSAPLNLASTAAVGVSKKFARADHVHALPAAADIVSTATGDVSATTVQGAIAELASEKAPLASPALTGTPTVPTASVNTSTTQAASTAFVVSQIANDAPKKDGTNATGTWPVAITGNAATATKLTNARTINVSGAVTGTATSFDGTASIVIPTTVTAVPGALVYGASATAYGSSAVGSLGQFAVSGGTSAPTWVTLDLSLVVGSPLKKVAVAATTGALTASFASNVLTNSGALSALVIDGVTLSVGDRVLVKDQASSLQNGVYSVTNIGSGVAAWVLTRAADVNTSANMAGALVSVTSGTVNGGDLFISQFKATDVLNTSPVLFNLEVDTGMASSATPLADGVATAGTSQKYAREGHVHPTDSTRAPSASPVFTGNPTVPTPAVGDSSTSIASTAFVAAAVIAAINAQVDAFGS